MADIRDERTLLALNSMSRVSWGAIFAGVFVSMFFQLLLSLLGIAIGLTLVIPAENISGGSARALTIGASIWLFLITLISIFAGTFTTGRLAGLSAKYDGILHGIVTFSFIIILSLTLTTAGLTSIISGVFGPAINMTNISRIQQMVPQAQETVRDAAKAQTGDPQEAQEKAEKYVIATAWLAFITGLISLGVAAWGGHMGMQSRKKQIARDEFGPQ